MSRIVGFITIAMISVSLTGCGIAAKVNARNDMEQSKNTYKACLAANAAHPAACEASRMAYEADMKAYRATSAGIQPGRSDTFNVNSEIVR